MDKNYPRLAARLLGWCAAAMLLAGATQGRADEVINVTIDNLTPGQATVTPGPLKLESRAFVRDNFDLARGLRVNRAANLPSWNHVASAFSANWPYTMVGKDPYNASSGQTSIPTWVIPVRVKFMPQNIVFDPSKPNACAGGAKVIDLVKQSPLFVNSTWKIGTTNVGGGPSQFANAFQRANYWNVLANKPGYKIVMPVKSGLAINLTANNFPNPIAVSCGKLGFLEINTWDAFVQNYIASHSASIKPAHLPLFVFSNVVMFETVLPNCCIGGYHSAFNNPSFGGQVQTYGNGAFLTNNAFGGAAGRDIAILSHEVIEWLADPFVNNLTPPWGHLGQVSGCQGNLETGDPLTGTSFTKHMPNGRNYHVQDEAFTSWFYRESPSTAIGGRYSYAGTFTTDAGPICN